MPLVITLDGPAGSGKSTTAKEVARRLGLFHLDSGALYRGIALALLRAGDGTVDPDSVDRKRIEDLDLDVTWNDQGPVLRLQGARIPDRDLRARAVTEVVSAVAAVPAVREWLLQAQRSGARPPGLVADGRDMGSVVFPDAQVKVFLEADPEIRAARRLRQLGAHDPTSAEVSPRDGTTGGPGRLGCGPGGGASGGSRGRPHHRHHGRDVRGAGRNDPGSGAPPRRLSRRLRPLELANPPSDNSFPVLYP